MVDGVTETAERGADGAGSAGVGAGPPQVPPPAATPGPPPPIHLRRWFLPLLVLSFLAIIGVGVLFIVAANETGPGSLADSLFDEYYSSDLTRGKGDFPTFADDQSSSAYAPDGYHLVSTAPYPAPRGVRANSEHTVLGVRIRTRAVTAPPGSMFGPFCWHTPTEGYGLLVGADGTAMIVETTPNLDSAFRVLRSARGTAFDWTQWHTLRIDCALNSMGGGDHTTARLTAYVDGTRIGKAISNRTASEFKYTGFILSSAEVQPAEWVVRSLDRLGSDSVR